MSVAFGDDLRWRLERESEGSTDEDMPALSPSSGRSSNSSSIGSPIDFVAPSSDSRSSQPDTAFNERKLSPCPMRSDISVTYHEEENPFLIRSTHQTTISLDWLKQQAQAGAGLDRSSRTSISSDSTIMSLGDDDNYQDWTRTSPSEMVAKSEPTSSMAMTRPAPLQRISSCSYIAPAVPFEQSHIAPLALYLAGDADSEDDEEAVSVLGRSNSVRASSTAPVRSAAPSMIRSYSMPVPTQKQLDDMQAMWRSEAAAANPAALHRDFHSPRKASQMTSAASSASVTSSPTRRSSTVEFQPAAALDSYSVGFPYCHLPPRLSGHASPSRMVTGDGLSQRPSLGRCITLDPASLNRPQLSN
ncbi:uncharacterized protein L969DRAFT_15781 [Mixia osmundae IAM 14324]|nr:uncharacterized protein L969DRAFT_15781 [Mixia osmundae IAM 14324]KEI41767.1 hypothetical protein L969DRAFT_15781 [Mixia osmundae IAM 14324]